MHDPSLSQSRPRFGCLVGTFSPSHRQIRSTRFLFTVHPALRSIADANAVETVDANVKLTQSVNIVRFGIPGGATLTPTQP